MIHYYGGPITPNKVAYQIWHKRHGLISFKRCEQLNMVQEYCQSYVLDNGAFSFWRAGISITSWDDYYCFVKDNIGHPAFDWAIIPDVVDGDENDNDVLLADWPLGKFYGVPVYHLHESLERLERLIKSFCRIAIGSSGKYSIPASYEWWVRMKEVRNVVCDINGRPRAKLHGLRQMNIKITDVVPYSSVDATSVGINAKLDKFTNGIYRDAPKEIRALALVERLEMRKKCTAWIE